MAFRLVFHPEVKDDSALLTRAVRARVRRAVETRLQTEPARYGKPLRGTLAGYWKLRVGDWRVVYTIRGAEVIVLAIRHRTRIYEEVRGRL